MVKSERHAFILHQVNLHNKILCTDLCKQINVSDDTIRRDIQQLADEGRLIKFHGGALSPSFHHGDGPSKSAYAYHQKRVIAQKAVTLIKDGMFVLTTGGTTILEMAKALPLELHATFISGSIPALAEYVLHPNIEVIAIGDKVSKHSKITVGTEAIMRLKDLKVDMCILGTSAINENGISDNDWEVVHVKKAMIESSKKLVCLTISEKLNSQQPLQVCESKRIDTLITELEPSHPLLVPYVHAGIRVM